MVLQLAFPPVSRARCPIRANPNIWYAPNLIAMIQPDFSHTFCYGSTSAKAEKRSNNQDFKFTVIFHEKFSNNQVFKLKPISLISAKRQAT